MALDDQELREIRLATARAWIRAMAIRKAVLADNTAADPAWNILLDLYLRNSENKPVSVSSATIASDTAATTGLRYVALLETRGLIFRLSDPDDGRRAYLRLTASGLEAVEIALDAATASDSKLGLERMILTK